MASSTESDRQPKPRIRKRLLIVFGVLLIWFIFDISGIGGNIRFYAKWIECGQKPVVANPEFRLGGGSVQYYAPAPNFKLIRLSLRQYCTPIEAEREGYSANPKRYEFPHLDAAGEQNPFLKREDERLKSMGEQPFDSRNNSE